jgi:peptidyl-prolyl cis-trans isomerase C
MVAVTGCPSTPARPIADAGAVAASWKGGSVGVDEVAAEARRLPPGLKEAFETSEGHREFARAVVAKRLLFDEAKRRGLSQREDIRRQVDELEQRLAVQALLDQEKRAQARPTDAVLKTYFEQHRAEFDSPAAVHVLRFFFKGGAPKDAAVKARADALRKQAVGKQPNLRVLAKQADGPEHLADGDIGWVTRAEVAGAEVALALHAVGEVSPVSAVEGGLAFFALLERREARHPEFEEVRALVDAKYAPTQDKQAYDKLIEKLMRDADVQFQASK